MLVFLKQILSFCSCTTLKIFGKAVCVRFDFVSCLSSEEESLHILSRRQQ